MISVIIPVGAGREMNLALSLHALAQQTYRDFEVVVCCDAPDGVHDVLRPFDLPVTYIWRTSMRPNLGAANRNIGARIALGEYLLFIDSDVMLNPMALEHYAADFVGFPNRAIAGPYHWCPPIVVLPSEIRDWEALATRLMAACATPRQTVATWESAKGYELNHHIGLDTRSCFAHSPDKLLCRYPDCLQLCSGNLAISSDVFWRVGGFCEELTSGIDGEFSLRLVRAGQVFSADSRTWGFHLYHDRAFALQFDETREKLMAWYHSDDSWLGQMRTNWD